MVVDQVANFAPTKNMPLNSKVTVRIKEPVQDGVLAIEEPHGEATTIRVWADHLELVAVAEALPQLEVMVVVV